MKTTKLGKIIKKLCLVFGVSLILVSVYLSYDGFDGSVSKDGAGAASIVSLVIGLILAITVTIVQFVFTNEYKQLNPTLFVAGLLTYAYSIWTNKMGAENILGMSGAMAWITAAMSDILAEPLVSYGLGESLVGDLLGNIWKAFSDDENEEKKPKFNHPQKSQYVPKHKPAHLRQEPTYHQVQQAKPQIQRGEDFFKGMG